MSSVPTSHHQQCINERPPSKAKATVIKRNGTTTKTISRDGTSRSTLQQQLRRMRPLMRTITWFLPISMILLGITMSLSSSSSYLQQYDIVYDDDNDSPTTEGQPHHNGHGVKVEIVRNMTEYDTKRIMTSTASTTAAFTTSNAISSVTRSQLGNPNTNNSTVQVPRATTPTQNDGGRKEAVKGNNEDKSNTSDDNEFFGACLLVMDDVSTVHTKHLKNGSRVSY